MCRHISELTTELIRLSEFTSGIEKTAEPNSLRFMPSQSPSFGSRFHFPFWNRTLCVVACLWGAQLGARATLPAITNIAMVPRLIIESDLGVTNTIEYTTNLSDTNWVALTNIFVTGSPYTFVDLSAPPSIQRFYRVSKVVFPPQNLAKSSGDFQAAVAGAQLANSLAVLVTDVGAHPVAGVTVNWAVSSGGGSVTTASSVTDAGGIATMTATLGSTGGANTFTATVSGLTGSPVTFTATGAKTITVNGGDGQTGVVGTQLATQLSVVVRDNLGNPVPGISVNWATTNGGASVGGPSSVCNASGIASINATLGTNGGANTFTATVSGLTGSPITFTATAAAAKTITLDSGNNQTGVVGTQLATPLAVLVRDNIGNPVAGITVNWAAASGGGSVGGPTSVCNASGIASINVTLGSTGGANTFTATVSGLTGSPVTFSANAAKTITLDSGNNQTGVVGTQLAAPLAVLVRDNLGNPVAGITVNWATTNGGASVGGPTSVCNAFGVTTINAFLGTNGGANTFTATVSGLTGSPVTFSANAAKTIAIDSGNNQTGVVGTQLATPLAVLVRDNLGNPVAGITVNWATTNGGASVGGPTSVCNAFGVATINAFLGTNGGANTFTATVSGLTGSPVTFSANAAKTIAVNSGNFQTGVAGTQLAAPLAVLVRDNLGNPVAGITVNWATTNGGASVGGPSSVCNAFGVATINAFLGTNGGANTFTATVSGLTGSPVTFSATAAKTITLNSGNGQNGTAGQQLNNPLTVLVRDNLGNPVSGITVSWAAASGGVSSPTSVSNASGIASVNATLGGTPGANTFTATVTGLTGSPVTFSATGN
jgi:hypothetical protein